ncbi:MAG: hypothetical protein VB066_10900 [Paludibacter sp.]|nr:hypothetical protein [Paludibacter sp.]
MSINNITQHRSVESIFKRIRFRIDRYQKTVIFEYNPEGLYNLQVDSIKLEDGEHPLFESFNRNGYTLLTTHYLYSIILNDKESPLLISNQLLKAEIHDIIYYKYISEIIEEKEKRKNYTECVLKFIPCKEEIGGVLLYLNVGNDEYLFHEVMRQLMCMNNQAKNLIKDKSV